MTNRSLLWLISGLVFGFVVISLIAGSFLRAIPRSTPRQNSQGQAIRGPDVDRLERLQQTTQMQREQIRVLTSDVRQLSDTLQAQQDIERTMTSPGPQMVAVQHNRRRIPRGPLPNDGRVLITNQVPPTVQAHP